MNHSESIANISKVLSQAINEIENVSKDKSGFKGKYADMPSVVRAVKEVLPKYELAFLQLVGEIIDDKISIENMLIHSSGEWISKTAESYIDDGMKSKPQGVGATITYLRRKSELAFFNMSEADELDKRKEQDDDEPHLSMHPIPSIPSKAEQNARYVPIENKAKELKKLSDLILDCKDPSATTNAICSKSNVTALSLLTQYDIRHWTKFLEDKLGESNE